MKLNITHILVCVSAAVASACTGNYLDINSNPYEVSRDQMMADGYAMSAAMKSLCSAVISTDVNTTQLTDVLLGGVCAGYYATSQSGFDNTVDNFNPTDDWTRVLMSSDKIIPQLYSNLAELNTLADEPEVMAIANIVKVTAMHRVTDTFGPIPYSQIGLDGKIQVPYDSQEAIYRLMFEQLDEAVDVLSEANGQLAANVDPIYNGDFKKWIKFANSLKLRLAMHVVYADRELARQMAESAVSAGRGGVMTDNADNAQLPSTAFGKDGNPLLVSFRYNTPVHEDKKVCLTGGDSHVAADIVCYMNGYNDPRREKYFIESEWENTESPYTGMRRGIEIPSLNETGHKYSGVRMSFDSPLQWMNAAEVAFLRAEGAAIFGFDMGGTAKDFYETGVRLSFAQWGASGVDEYLKDEESQPEKYTDPAGENSYDEELSTITIAWNDGASDAEKQERIITQKWIANFNLGHESWVDYRRTGYPHLLPATQAGNKSGGIVNSKLGARRMPYPQAEFTNNAANIMQALSEYLGGPDNMATRLWWDCNPAIAQ